MIYPFYLNRGRRVGDPCSLSRTVWGSLFVVGEVEDSCLLHPNFLIVPGIGGVTLARFLGYGVAISLRHGHRVAAIDVRQDVPDHGTALDSVHVPSGRGDGVAIGGLDGDLAADDAEAAGLLGVGGAGDEHNHQGNHEQHSDPRSHLLFLAE